MSGMTSETEYYIRRIEAYKKAFTWILCEINRRKFHESISDVHCGFTAGLSCAEDIINEKLKEIGGA